MTIESEFIVRARSMRPVARAAAAEAERERRLPSRVAEAMAKEGLYRVAAPKWIAGAEASPDTQIRVIEAVSEGDGAAGWNLMIGIESFSLVGLAFRKDLALFSDPTTIVCGSTANVGRADRVDGGYRVSGQWSFVSGCHNSRVFAGLVNIHENGKPVPGQLAVQAAIPSEEFEIIETWNVAGLRGSGSHDVKVDDVFVPEEHLGTGLWNVDRERLADSTVLRIPLGPRLAYNKVAVGFGIARAALDEFTKLATGKTPRFSAIKLRERPHAQRAIARAEVRLRSARALVLESAGTLWDTVRANQQFSDKSRALFAIACSDAALACAEAVDAVAEAAGTTANQLDSPLEKLIRDVRVIRQHVTVAPSLIEDGGRVLLGLEPESVMLKIFR
jgi:alkylation response protein AidB-like acyl-CoA dehydrogenase